MVRRWGPRTRTSVLFREGLSHQSLQLNPSTTVTLGTEESGGCKEVETRVNVWTVRQKKVAVVERCREALVSSVI